MDAADISFEHLPILRPEEVRESVRTGEELRIGSASLTHITFDDPNILTKLREFSAQELIVLHRDGTILGRLERTIPSPLPEYADHILAICARHIHEIRSRCNVIIHVLAEKERALGDNPSQQFFLHRLTEGARLGLVNIELSIQRIRNGLEAALYHEFAHDIFHEEEFLTRIEAHIHKQYAQEKQLLVILEQPLGLT